MCWWKPGGISSAPYYERRYPQLHSSLPFAPAKVCKSANAMHQSIFKINRSTNSDISTNTKKNVETNLKRIEVGIINIQTYYVFLVAVLPDLTYNLISRKKARAAASSSPMALRLRPSCRAKNLQWIGKKHCWIMVNMMVNQMMSGMIIVCFCIVDGEPNK